MDLANPAAFCPTLLAARPMVCAGHPLAAMAGMRVLEAGGNAVDAGVAAGFALNVVQPEVANLGGVAPIVIREPTGTAAYQLMGGLKPPFWAPAARTIAGTDGCELPRPTILAALATAAIVGCVSRQPPPQHSMGAATTA